MNKILKLSFFCCKSTFQRFSVLFFLFLVDLKQSSHTLPVIEAGILLNCQLKLTIETQIATQSRKNLLHTPPKLTKKGGGEKFTCFYQQSFLVITKINCSCHSHRNNPKIDFFLDFGFLLPLWRQFCILFSKGSFFHF